MNYITCSEASALMGTTVRRIQQLCKNGEISGAKKQGRSWIIPADFIAASKKLPMVSQKKKPLPIGISDFKVATTSYYYVDKTLLIRDFIDSKPMVTLFTRPRRFGKTLNMDMLRVFFEKTTEDTSVYFQDKLIWQCGREYTDHQGQYPVIFLTFKDVKCASWNETLQKIRKLISLEFLRHIELESSPKLNSYEKEQFTSLANNSATEVDYQMSLHLLSLFLHKHHGEKAIIIIDEYDTPIQQGYSLGYYEDVINFMRSLFSGGLKDNEHLAFGFLTGILRVAKESIFSGLNNLTVNSVLDSKFSTYFGFTSDEVKTMTEYYNVVDKYEEICDWYDGFRFGKSEIFNPWSVINYFYNECEPRAYWQSTGSNNIIGEIIAEADRDIYTKLTSLVSGSSITSYVDTNVIYPQIRQAPSAIYSFLLIAGYLKIIKSTVSSNGDFLCELALPNKEISFVYNKEILQKLNSIIPLSTAIAVQEAIYSGDSEKIQRQIHDLLLHSASCFDTVGENFYHGFILGLCAMLSDSYTTSSNRESGEGRYDIQLMPKQHDLPGILIELKATKKCSEFELKNLADIALRQIIDKKYDTTLLNLGVTKIYKYGVAFSGKNVAVSVG